MKNFILIGMMLFTPTVWAGQTAESIDGAFGITLGKAPDKSVLHEHSGGDHSGDQYGFEPENPYAPLTEYSVFLSRHDGTAYQIQALGQFNSAKSCRSELDVLAEALTRKYGSPNRDMAAKQAGVSRISFGDRPRRITISCSGFFGKQTLKLVYSDNSLEQSARQPAGPGPQPVGNRDTKGL